VPVLTTTGRKARLGELEGRVFDLVVVGGGITGAGIARQASQCGLSVALLEAEDFAAGTSSRSSKLIHGGLRYLAMGDVGLVRETALERKAVHKLAAHLAEPAWMVVPARSRGTLLKFRAGIATYEKLGAVAPEDRHHNWNREDLAGAEPWLDRTAFPWACAYREYLTDDARLVLAVLRAAVNFGALVTNHLRAEEFTLSRGQVDGLVARCGLTGERIRVRGKAVINAAGPWVEDLLLTKRDDRTLHLSKGIHIAVPHPRLPLNNLIVLSTPDKRSIFAIPRGDVTYIGTTDTSYEGGPTLWPEILADDVNYLLAPLPRFFPDAALSRQDVVSAWAGLRPLVNQPGKAAREMSRKDEVWVGETGLVSIAGGKLTGFRKMAEDALQAVAPQFAQSLPCKDPLEPLPGGQLESVDELARRISRQYGLEDSNALRLVRLYGSETEQVIELNPEPVAESSRLLKGEIEWAVQVEAACCLEDVLYRRLRIAWFEPEEVRSNLDAIARLLAHLLGWSETEKKRQIDHIRNRRNKDMDFQSA